MARIIQKGADLASEYQALQSRIRKKAIFGFSFFGAGILSFLISPFLAIPLLGSGMIALVQAYWAKGKADILKAGAEGEIRACHCMTALPDSYAVFRNLKISCGEKQSELDLLVVGPTGLFVIEVKNRNGHIYGDTEDAYWTQYKVGRGGTPYEKSFYNPVKQVNTHVYRVAKYLKQHGICNYIQSAVYFPNIETSSGISQSGSKTPVFFAKDGGTNDLLQYILDYDQQLTQNECDRIVNLLTKA